jgi:hypothetical protein
LAMAAYTDLPAELLPRILQQVGDLAYRQAKGRAVLAPTLVARRKGGIAAWTVRR